MNNFQVSICGQIRIRIFVIQIIFEYYSNTELFAHLCDGSTWGVHTFWPLSEKTVSYSPCRHWVNKKLRRHFLLKKMAPSGERYISLKLPNSSLERVESLDDQPMANSFQFLLPGIIVDQSGWRSVRDWVSIVAYTWTTMNNIKKQE